MSARQLAEVVLKVWALVTLFTGLAQLPGLLITMADAAGSSRVGTPGLVVAAGPVLSIFAAIVLLRYARPVLEPLIEDAPPTDPALLASPLLHPLLVVLGVYFVVSGLRLCSVAAFELFTAQGGASVGAPASAWARNRYTALPGLVELVCGALVLRLRNLIPTWLQPEAAEATEP